MKVTLIHRYFWPDKAPYAQMLYSIAKGLADSDIDTSVLTTMPTHHVNALEKAPTHEVVNGFSIKRIRLLPEPRRNLILRALNSYVFAIRVFISLIFARNDVVMVATTPPVIMGLTVRWASKFKKFQYIYHCQDLHPEAMGAIGLKRNSLLYRILNHIDKANIVAAGKVVVLSEDMKTTLAKRGIPIDNLKVLNNFIFEEFKPTDSQATLLDKNYFNILFAGNLGKFQGLEHLLQAALETRHELNIRYIIVGDGVERSKLESIAGELVNHTVFFYDRVPITKALQFMGEANLGLIMLNKGVIEYAYPSKTMMYLSMGLPLLVTIEESSTLSKMVKQNSFGYSCEPESAESLAKAILFAWNNQEKLLTSRQKISDFAKNEFGKKSVINRWIDLYKNI